MSDSSTCTNSSDNKRNEVYKSQDSVRAVCRILTEIIQENKESSLKSDVKERLHRLVFHAKKTPSVNIQGYIDRILKYTYIEESTLILCLIYIDRLCELNDILLTDLNIHR